MSQAEQLGYDCTMYKIVTEEEVDGRWIAEVPELPGVLVYGQSREEAVRKAQALSLHVLAERLEHGEALPQAIDPTALIGAFEGSPGAPPVDAGR
jgi:predicted RNase H-like HicB family nuclease